MKRERRFCRKDCLERLGLDLNTEPRLSIERDLVNRGVLVEIGGALRATLYGLPAFGKNPQLYPQTQNFWIECVSYAGDDRADEVFQTAEGRGRIDEQVERAVGWFKIDTPLGGYNPDWAVLLERDGEQRLYFVIESKGSVFTDDLRPTEKAKIDCGRAHFKALGTEVQFKVSDSFEHLGDLVSPSDL